MSGATRRDNGKLGGLKRRQIVRELALGEQSQRQLAEKYEVSEAAISQFKNRYADEIEAVRQDTADEFAGILIAQKQARLAAYNDLYEKAIVPSPKVSPSGKIVKDLIPDPDNPGGPWIEAVVVETDVRAAALVLKQAAEEMGQLPTRLQIQGDMQTTTTYRIEGANPEDLK